MLTFFNGVIILIFYLLTRIKKPNIHSASDKASGELRILKDELNEMRENEQKLKAVASLHEEEIKTLRTQLNGMN